MLREKKKQNSETVQNKRQKEKIAFSQSKLIGGIVIASTIPNGPNHEAQKTNRNRVQPSSSPPRSSFSVLFEPKF
jgi:hypothetical protein